MNPIIESIPRSDWTPLPHEGCTGVAGKVLLKTSELCLAMLQFEANGTIHEHPADIEIDVICLAGQGMTSIAGEIFPLQADQKIRWPAGLPHRLWTEGTTLTTLMVEHTSSDT